MWKVRPRPHTHTHLVQNANSGNQGFRDLVLPSLPQSLKSLYYFTDVFIEDYLYGSGRKEVFQRDSTPSLELLQEHAQRFTELVFCQPWELFPFNFKSSTHVPGLTRTSNPWSGMKVVSFKSRLLNPDGDLEQIDQLLIGAAAIAKAMPRLRLMETWDFDDDAPITPYGCVFRYAVDHFESTISWYSTWDYDGNWSFSSEVARAWAGPAFMHSQRYLASSVSKPSSLCKYDEPFFRHRIRAQVVHPFTADLQPFNHPIFTVRRYL